MGNGNSRDADFEDGRVTDEHGWNYTLCGCSQPSCRVCAFVWCCPACAHGLMVRMVRHDEDIAPCDQRCFNPNCFAYFIAGGCYHTGVSCAGFLLRGEIRRAYGVDGTGCHDLCCHVW